MKIIHDDWLSGILGYDVYNLNNDEAQAVIDIEMPKSKSFLYAKVASTRLDIVRYLELIKFNIIDVNVVFELSPTQLDTNYDENITICKIEQNYESAVLDIAKSCFRYSRFHIDPYIPNVIADKIKYEWVMNYITKNRGEKLLIILKDGRPVGFLAEMLLQNSIKSISVIDLIGIDKEYQGMGLGKYLINNLIQDSFDKVDSIRVTTQVANIPSIRLYESCGFKIIQSEYVLHAHID